jgi:hypothetical protein
VHGTLQHCSRGRSVRFQKGLVFRHFRVTRGVAGVGEAAHFRRPPPRKFSVAVGGRGLPYSDVSIIACFDSVEYLYRLNLVLQQNHVWEQPLYIHNICICIIYIYTHSQTHTRSVWLRAHVCVCVCVCACSYICITSVTQGAHALLSCLNSRTFLPFLVF